MHRKLFMQIKEAKAKFISKCLLKDNFLQKLNVFNFVSVLSSC